MNSVGVRAEVQAGITKIEKFLQNEIGDRKVNVYDAISKLNWNKPSDKKIIYFILMNLEYEAGGSSRILLREDLTLDHIYPKSIEGKDSIEGWEAPDFVFKELGHGIGNLTLLPEVGPHANGSAGEKPFSIKKDEYYLPSNLASNRYFESIDNWNGSAIKARLKYIQEKVWQRWGPIES